ncbi:MAG TPA: DinB family protein [Thermoanaerobaculia bacterium]|nr:DinB family protein [Thermoanaerobaculia bacterium]
MQVLPVLLANLDHAYDKRGWHGPTLRGALRGLAANDVYWRPAKKRHNIWELTAHAAYWKYAVRQRLGGAKRGSFPLKGSNWIAAPSRPDEEAWRDVVVLLDSEHRRLRDFLASMDEAALDDAKKVRMLYGVAAHDVYHTGQIQLIKRLRKD